MWTHKVVYMTQVRVEEFVRVDPATGVVVEAGPMLKLFEKLTLHDIRRRKMITKIEDLNPPPPELVGESLITLTDAK